MATTTKSVLIEVGEEAAGVLVEVTPRGTLRVQRELSLQAVDPPHQDPSLAEEVNEIVQLDFVLIVPVQGLQGLGVVLPLLGLLLPESLGFPGVFTAIDPEGERNGDGDTQAEVLVLTDLSVISLILDEGSEADIVEKIELQGGLTLLLLQGGG